MSNKKEKKPTAVDRFAESGGPKVRWFMSRWMGKAVAASFFLGSLYVGVKHGLDISAPEQVDGLKEGVEEYGKLAFTVGASAVVGFSGAYLLGDIPKEQKKIDLNTKEEPTKSQPADVQAEVSPTDTPFPEAAVAEATPDPIPTPEPPTPEQQPPTAE